MLVKFNGQSDPNIAKRFRTTIDNFIGNRIVDNKTSFKELFTALKKDHTVCQKIIACMNKEHCGDLNKNFSQVLGFIQYLILIFEDINELSNGTNNFLANQENKAVILSIIDSIKLQLAFDYTIEKIAIKENRVPLSRTPEDLFLLELYRIIKENSSLYNT